MFSYILEELPFNKELSSEIGVDYANDGKSIRYNPVRVEVESWTETHNNVHDCVSHGYCERCANNDNFDMEVIEIRMKKSGKSFRFIRTLYHQLGSVWSSWYDESYSVSPIK